VFQAATAAADVRARTALLDRECGNDRELRQQVEALLRSEAGPTATAVHEGDSTTTNATVGIEDIASGGVTGESAAGPRYPAGGRLGKYEIKSFLARGGMGEVYHGFDPLVERDVALKVLPADVAATKTALQRFLAEARAVGKLLHTHTVALYEIGQDGPTLYLAMEFVPGGSVADLLARLGRLEWRQATRYLIEVCHGLAAAHAVGIMHRDIKPENLLRTADDHIKITDFGLAKALDALGQLGLTKPGSVLGTPYYMSPEQFEGAGIDHRSDLYSAGATYYHLLTGQRPYAELESILQVMVAHGTRPVPDPRALLPELPAGCAAVIARAMAKRQDDRYASATEMAAALGALLEEKPARSEVVFWLVEPSRLQARSLQVLLGELGVARTRVFTTMAEALVAASQGLPTALLAALHLADGSGEELADKMRGLPGGGAVVSFLLSSDASKASPATNRAGRPIVLVKPVTKDMLAQVVERVRALTG
jgi:CheY-like chemotaxis protein